MRHRARRDPGSADRPDPNRGSGRAEAVLHRETEGGARSGPLRRDRRPAAARPRLGKKIGPAALLELRGCVQFRMRPPAQEVVCGSSGYHRRADHKISLQTRTNPAAPGVRCAQWKRLRTLIERRGILCAKVPMKTLTSFSLLRFGLFIDVLAFLVLVPLPRSSANQNRQKEPKKAAAQERQDYYKKWLREDVLYIITDDERKVFQALTTPEEKDAFIEQFWSRRDPDPRTGNNEFKEEHYRRIAYANENFFSGKDGWATDRGRIYITFGPPTHIEDNSGGVYRRRPEEGGGYTSTYSFQRWFYNEIPGVGRGIEVEFVDATKTGEDRLALRPSEKDGLLNVGGGLTWEEAMANPDSGQNVDRAGVMLSDLAGRNIGGQNEPMYMRGAQSFERVRKYFN